MRLILIVGFGCLSVLRLTAAPAYPSDAPSLPGSTERATGFFRTCQDGNGVWWMVDPLGRRFLALGVDHVTYSGFPSAVDGKSRYGEANDRKFASRERWAEDTVARLRRWKFTMLGSGCDEILRHRGLPHMGGMPLGLMFKDNGDPDRLIGRKLPNVYSPEFEPFCRRRAREIAVGTRGDPWLVGYFLDNELCWYVKGGSPVGTGIYEGTLDLPDAHSAKKALGNFLMKRGYRLGDRVPKSVKEAFSRETADLYFRTITAAVRAADPDHLVFSCRFEGFEGGDPYVWEIGGKYCDVMTLNTYPWADIDRNFVMTRGDARGRPIREEFDRYQEICGKPMFVSEWSFVSTDSEVDCLRGAGQRFRTQGERSKAVSLFSETMLGRPFLVGYDYFMWLDTPQGGIGGPYPNPESCNYGLVNEQGEAYPIAQALAAVQDEASEWHCSGGPVERRDLPQTRFVAASQARKALSIRAQSDSDVETKDAFVLSEAKCLETSGAVGSDKLLNAVRFEGGEFGSLSASVGYLDGTRERWLRLSRVSRILRRSADGQVVLSAESPLADGRRCRALFRFSLVSSVRGLLVEVGSVESVGPTNFLPRTVVFSVASPFAAEKESAVRENAMRNMWKSSHKDGWFALDGRYLGALTLSEGVENWKFFLRGKEKTPQCDLVMVLPRDRKRFTPWLLLLAGTDGYAGWKKMSEDLDVRLFGGL